MTSAQAYADQPTTKPKRKRSKVRWIILGIFAAALLYAAYDMFGPRASRLRQFNPNEVARIETAMWRSYYSRERFKLFNQLSELLRTQYNLPYLRSNWVAYKAARAAFVFKDGRSRDDYEKALPYLQSFYSAIRKVSDIPFDVNRAARLEVEWWIIHRERNNHSPDDLPRALAALQGEIFQMPAEKFMEHARLRAEAMTIRDEKADAGGVTEQDWARIDELLHKSWQALYDIVNGQA
ncbi:MAG TPA: hypothetical protein VNN73_05005 [Blastocatellia bacterium]|nr:hypothetical protein [Blastocatellia bacterium]